jgi:hypothetical protein
VFLLKIWKIAVIFALGGVAAIGHFLGNLFGRKAPEADTGWESYTAPEPEGELGHLEAAAADKAASDEGAPCAPPGPQT